MLLESSRSQLPFFDISGVCKVFGNLTADDSERSEKGRGMAPLIY
jgi:hypothetical protein